VSKSPRIPEPSGHGPASGQVPARRGFIDIRPIVHIIGWLLLFMAVLMLAPALTDLADRREDENAFLRCAAITGVTGSLLALATADAARTGLGIRQAFLLTVAIWVVLPLFGCLPFMFGPPHLGFTDALFEAVSGITTTGATVIVGCSGSTRSRRSSASGR
jgi:trk system potassium uptake protein TrkH